LRISSGLTEIASDNPPAATRHWRSAPPYAPSKRSLCGTRSRAADAERIAREVAQINDMVTALTMSIDPANMAMLNDRLTQLRLRKDALEEELRMARRSRGDHDPAELRHWAR